MDRVAMVLTGAGGAGVMTAGQMLLDAAAQDGLFGLMTRSTGPQIRGGEAAAFVTLSPAPVECPDDQIDLHLAFDWMNIERFAAELALGSGSWILYDDKAGEVPQDLVRSDAQTMSLPLSKTAKVIKGGRANMVGLGVIARLTGLSDDAFSGVIKKTLARKGESVIEASLAAFRWGHDLAADIDMDLTLKPAKKTDDDRHWNISGNEATGLGALRGGVRFVAAYPITPATEVLEWLAPNLKKVGGTLVQAEDELASINMVIGASFGGVPSLTATAGPGLALMTEAMGLAVASETPVVVVNVQRGGPSTGIPTKSEQSDLDIALHGLHGDAPHIVTAASSIADSLFTTQWTVHLAEALQTAAIVLTDQYLGQARAVIERPAEAEFVGHRRRAKKLDASYRRYAASADGVSAVALPGDAGGAHVADGLEHDSSGRPSSRAEDHLEQLDKRARKLTEFDYAEHWATLEGEGDFAVVTWGSSTGPARLAVRRARRSGVAVRLISLRLLMPAQPQKMADALRGVTRILVVEQSHSRQFYRYLRAHYDLPERVDSFHQPGPLPIRPKQILDRLT